MPLREREDIQTLLSCDGRCGDDNEAQRQCAGDGLIRCGDDLSAYSLPDDPREFMSPQYWEKLEKRLPRKLRKELAPFARQAKEMAEYEARRPAIEAAHDALEKCRGKYERLCNKPAKLLARAEKLFSEPAFETMRFSADDLQRAFEAVGYPSSNRVDDAFIEIVVKATDFLVDDKQRDALARRLVYMLPDYVAEGRHLDAWIMPQYAFCSARMPARCSCRSMRSSSGFPYSSSVFAIAPA